MTITSSSAREGNSSGGTPQASEYVFATQPASRHSKRASHGPSQNRCMREGRKHSPLALHLAVKTEAGWEQQAEIGSSLTWLFSFRRRVSWQFLLRSSGGVRPGHCPQYL